MRRYVKAEAAAWKTQFAKNLHMEGKSQLKKIRDYMKWGSDWSQYVDQAHVVYPCR